MSPAETNAPETAPVLDVRHLKKYFPLQEKGLLRRDHRPHQGGG